MGVKSEFMKRIIYFFCTGLIFITSLCNASSNFHTLLPGWSAVTYKLNGGRFGDDLVSYCKAKWLSYKNNIPFVYQPFKHSNHLMLHMFEIERTKKVMQQFNKVIRLPSCETFHINPCANILYISQWKTKVRIDWKDQKFLAMLKKCIAPRVAVKEIKIPSDAVTVAVHIRTGGGYYVDKVMCCKWPRRFAPEHFYIDQIKYLAQLFDNVPLYVHIFTDDPHPERIVKRFKRIFINDHITFGCRKKKNRHNRNVIEDFFAMMQFDCLIRPCSNFSRFVERLGNHKIVIFPRHVTRVNKNKWIVDKVAIRKCTK